MQIIYNDNGSPAGADIYYDNLTGNVGVGTFEPTEKLQVDGTLQVGDLKFWGNSSGDFQSSGDLRPHIGSSNFSIWSGDVGSGTEKFRVQANGDVGIGTAPQSKLHVAGNLKVDGQYHNGSALSGYIQPVNWSYSSSATSWTQLWSGTVTVPKDSVMMISIMGHWSVTGGWSYLGGMIDGVPMHPAASSCWGATHTYFTNWHPTGYTATTDITAGTHTIGVGVVCSGGTVSVNGARLYYMIIPK